MPCSSMRIEDCPLRCARRNGLCDAMLSTLTSTTTITSPPSCPRNCGSTRRGGGTCRQVSGADTTTVACLSCDASRLLYHGRCVVAVRCRARAILSGVLQGLPCACPGGCHACRHTINGTDCIRCRDGLYLLDGACVESCPATMASSGVSLWGRRCEEPFTCERGRVVGNFWK